MTTQDRDTGRMACRAPRSSRGRKGIDPKERRTRAAAPGAAVGAVDKAYRFDTDEGSATLADLFGGRSQLLVYHFMFGPDYTAGCPSCSTIADGFNGFASHLANHDVALWAVSRAPLAKLQGYKQRLGWTFPWASSLGSDFNFDFSTSITEAQQKAGASNTITAKRRPSRSPRRRRRRPWPSSLPRAEPIRSHLQARSAGHERLRARERRGLSHLFHLCARTGRAVGYLPVARPRAQGPQRGGHLVAPPRRIRQALTSQRRADARSVVRHPHIDESGGLRLRLTRPTLLEIVPLRAMSCFGE